MKKNEDVVIYSINCPTSNDVKYIGKTTNLTNRISQHKKESKRFIKNPDLYDWMRNLKNNGLNPVYTIIEKCDNDKWEQREAYWIKFYKDSGIKIFNKSDGGKGPKGFLMTEESRSRISNSKKGKKIKGKEVELHVNGLVISFKTITDAGEVMGICISAISNNLNGTSKTTRKGVWKYKKNEKENTK